MVSTHAARWKCLIIINFTNRLMLKDSFHRNFIACYCMFNEISAGVRRVLWLCLRRQICCSTLVASLLIYDEVYLILALQAVALSNIAAR